MSRLRSVFRSLARPDGVGLLVNVGTALAAVLLVNGVIFGLGWDKLGPNSSAVPDYPVGLIWTTLFALMGAARWRLNAAATPTARRAQRIIVLLAGTCLLYPFATLGFASRGAGLVGNALILILAGWAVARAWPVTRSAAAMLFPVIPWVLFASTLIGREMGWI